MKLKAFPVCEWWDHQDMDTSFGTVIVDLETLRPLPLRHDAFFRVGQYGNDDEGAANRFAVWLAQQGAGAELFDPDTLDRKLAEWRALP